MKRKKEAKKNEKKSEKTKKEAKKRNKKIMLEKSKIKVKEKRKKDLPFSFSFAEIKYNLKEKIKRKECYAVARRENGAQVIIINNNIFVCNITIYEVVTNKTYNMMLQIHFFLI